jgi:NAD(P)H dehydrogenase (quinone)
MYAVTGATGQLGRKVVASLLERVPASEIVALARDPDKAQDLGVATRHADYLAPATLEAAFAGIDTLLLISSNGMDTRRQEHADVIAAAQKVGVGRIVYTSLLHAEDWNHWFAGDHLETEALIRASGLPFTILRNGWYWENHTVAIAPSLPYGAMIGSAGRGLVSWASRQDFAEAAAVVMTTEGHAGRTYELAGDEAHRLSDLAAEVARRTGRPFVYRDLSEADHAAALAQAGLPPRFAAMVAEVEARGVSTGVLHEDVGVLKRLIGRKTTTLEQAVAEALAAAPQG